MFLLKDPSVVPNSDNAFTLFYVRFRAAAPKVRVSKSSNHGGLERWSEVCLHHYQDLIDFLSIYLCSMYPQLLNIQNSSQNKMAAAWLLQDAAIAISVLLFYGSQAVQR